MRRAIGVLLVLAACGGDDSSGGDGGGGGGDAAHQTCLTETNKYRTGGGKAAIAQSDALETYADTGAMFDFSNAPHAHFMQTGGGGIAFAENECPQQLGWTLPTGADPGPVVAMCIKAFFDEGPGGGHYENLMGNYAHLGCGIYAASGKITILQDFGN